MVEQIRYHLDENVDPDVAAGLRRHGIDVTTTFESGLQGQSDDVQWKFVSSEGRVMMTHDTDFLRLSKQDPNHAGIVYCAKDARSVGEMIRSLMLIFELMSAEEMRGRVEYI
jgi:predicted nuclease of predicted toxin-antitoxin system